MRSSVLTSGVGVLVALLAHTALANPVANTFLTPNGYRATTNLHPVPKGGRVAHVGSKIHVFDTNSNVVEVVNPTAAAVTPEETGWVAYASWMNTGSTPIEIFTSEFTVPPAPATYDSQTIFIFPSIEPSTFDAIMQPVLQYGGSAAGGGEYWAVATWYLYSDDTFYTTPIEVSPGQSLGGVIWFLEESGGAYNYIAGFAGMGDTELEVDGGEQLTWATNTLESYGVTQASDYPAGSTVFTEVSILLTNGQYAPVSWSTSSDPADGLYTTVNVNGGDNAVITITY